MARGLNSGERVSWKVLAVVSPKILATSGKQNFPEGDVENAGRKGVPAKRKKKEGG